VKQRGAPDQNMVGRVRHCGDAIETKLGRIGYILGTVDLLAQRPLVICEHTVITATAAAITPLGNERQSCRVQRHLSQALASAENTSSVLAKRLAAKNVSKIIHVG